MCEYSVSTKVVCSCIQKQIIKNQGKIAKKYRSHYNKKKHIFLSDIFYVEASPFDTVQLIGEFTNPPWSPKIPMKFSPFFKCMHVRTLIKENAQFKFIANENYRCSTFYEASYNDGHYNNIYSLNKHYSKSALSKSLAAPKLPSGSPTKSLPNQLSDNTIEFTPKGQKSLNQKNNLLKYVPTLFNIKEKNTQIVQSPEIYPDLENKSSIDYKEPTSDTKQISKALFPNTTDMPKQPSSRQDTNQFKSADKLETRQSFESIFPNKSSTLTAGSAFKFISSYKIIPKFGERSEDSCFIHDRALGVADGVSGWNAFGLNASEFSCSLMINSFNLVQTDLKYLAVDIEGKKAKLKNAKSQMSLVSDEMAIDKENEKPISFYSKILDPIDIMQRALDKVTAIGSSTACICTINKGELKCANLGDSGFLLFRKSNKGIYLLKDYSKDQQHEFNTPFQLSNLPQKEHYAMMDKEGKHKEMEELRKAVENAKLCHDIPTQSDLYTIPLQHEDLVVLASDGVLDNLFGTEIKKIIDEITLSSKWEISKVGVKMLAEHISSAAYEKSKLNEANTPFRVRYKRNYKSDWPSGKEDDITVVIGLVQKVNYN